MIFDKSQNNAIYRDSLTLRAEIFAIGISKNCELCEIYFCDCIIYCESCIICFCNKQT